MVIYVKYRNWYRVGILRTMVGFIYLALQEFDVVVISNFYLGCNFSFVFYQGCDFE